MTGRVWKDDLTYAEATELKKDHNVDINTNMVKKYANGTRDAYPIRIVDEGKELTFTKLSSGKYDIGNKDDQIFTDEFIERQFSI